MFNLPTLVPGEPDKTQETAFKFVHFDESGVPTASVGFTVRDAVGNTVGALRGTIHVTLGDDEVTCSYELSPDLLDPMGANIKTLLDGLFLYWAKNTITDTIPALASLAYALVGAYTKNSVVALDELYSEPFKLIPMIEDGKELIETERKRILRHDNTLH